MKKLIFLVLGIIATSSLTHAQFFIGGNFSMNATGGSSKYGSGDEVKTESTFDFSLYPEFGIGLSDKMDVGAYAGFGYSHSNDNGDPEKVENTSTVGIAPFLRYYLYRPAKFGIYVEALMPIHHSVEKTTQEGYDYDDTKTNVIGLIAAPGMSYKITGKIELMAGLDFMRFGYTFTGTKSGDYKSKSSDFGLKFNMNDILTTGYVTIGAIVRL